MLRHSSVFAVLLAVSGSGLPRARADEPAHLSKVELALDVTWAGKRGIQIPIKKGSTTMLRGQCPPVIEMNTHIEPQSDVPIDAHYSFSDGHVLNRNAKAFMDQLPTEQWNIPIQDVGQEFKGSVTLHIASPASAENDITVPFSVACAPKLAPGAVECDTTGDSCNSIKLRGKMVPTEISAELPPKSWSGGTFVPGTYVLTAARQYTFAGTTVTASDSKPSQMTVVLKNTATGVIGDLVTSDGSCTQHGAVSGERSPLVKPGMYVPEWEPVFSGAHALALSNSCPAPDGPAMSMGSAYSITPTGFKIMLMFGTVLTFTRTP